MRSDIVSFRIFIGVFAVHKFVDHNTTHHSTIYSPTVIVLRSN